MAKIPPTPVSVTDEILCDVVAGQREIVNELRAIRTAILEQGGKPRRLKEPKP